MTDDPVVVFLGLSVDEVRDGQYNGDLPDDNNGQNHAHRKTRSQGVDNGQVPARRKTHLSISADIHKILISLVLNVSSM